MAESDETSGNLINNEAKITGDTREIMRYVKDTLFYRVIDVYDDEKLLEGAFFHQDFMKNVKPIITGGASVDALNSEWLAYMKYLWTRLSHKKMYKEWLAMKRSNCYQAVQDRFFRKYRRT